MAKRAAFVVAKARNVPLAVTGAAFITPISPKGLLRLAMLISGAALMSRMPVSRTSMILTV
jgi:hypothetical protein